MNFKTTFFVLSLFLTSYSASEVDSIGMLNKVSNTWEFQYSYGGFAGTQHLPSYKYRLVFTNEASGCVFKEYKNDTLINTDSFAINYQNISGMMYYYIFMDLKSLENSTTTKEEGFNFYFQDDSTMIFNEGCCDRNAFYFKLIKPTARIQHGRINKPFANSLPVQKTMYDLTGRKILSGSRKLPGGMYLEYSNNGIQTRVNKIVAH